MLFSTFTKNMFKHSHSSYPAAITFNRYATLLLLMFCFFIPASANPALNIIKNKPTAELDSKPTVEEKKPITPVPADEYNRATPQSSLKGYLKAANDGDNTVAAKYLDLRYLPNGLGKKDGPWLARQLKIVLDRALWVDMDLVSNQPEGNLRDGLPDYRDTLGTIKAGKQNIAVLLQLIPRKDGVAIWKFSNRTVGKIPLLYEYHGYSPLEEYLEGVFPDVQVFGWHSWQWATYLVLVILAYFLAFLPTWFSAHLINRKPTPFRLEVAHYLAVPVRTNLWILFIHYAVELLGPSDQIRAFNNSAVLLYFVTTWAFVRLTDLAGLWVTDLLKKQQRLAAQVLLNPIKTFFKVIIILTGVLLWLDNMGVQVSTLLASMGIGGLAFALASQDMLKNLLGSIMILMDRPYEIGQRIIAKGHDGIVEEIGLRSTKIRLLNGHQATIPNENMAKIDIENIGRRPHIKHTANIAIPLDTPLEKVEKAVAIIRKILENHECMHENFPPRVFFNTIARDAFNIRMIFWYRSNNYWAFQAYNEQLNLRIIRDFRAAGIRFALPAFKSFSAQQVPENAIDISPTDAMT